RDAEAIAELAVVVCVPADEGADRRKGDEADRRARGEHVGRGEMRVDHDPERVAARRGHAREDAPNRARGEGDHGDREVVEVADPEPRPLGQEERAEDCRVERGRAREQEDTVTRDRSRHLVKDRLSIRFSRPSVWGSAVVTVSARMRHRHVTFPSVRCAAMAKAATPWGPAELVDELKLAQTAGGKRFSSLVQLLEAKGGE